MNYLNELINNQKIFFKFMKEKYPLFTNSNIFLRDVQYAIRSYFEKKNIKLGYTESEKLTLEFIDTLTKENKLKKISSNAWKVNFFLDNDVNTTESNKNQEERIENERTN